MLSIDDENPPPLIPQLNNCNNINSGIDDKDKAHRKLPSLADLFPSGQPSEKFSIRDYAFRSRSKGIENSWPFSPKILQTCLKNGLKNVLPDFESPEAIRQANRRAVVSEEVLESTEEAVRNLTLGTVDSEEDRDHDHGMFVDSNDAVCSLNPPILVEGGNKESTCSEIESFPTRKSPELEAEILPEKLVAKPKTTASRTNQAVKKHRLAVKVSNLSSKEDNPVSNFMVSEAMASKVCPVCKTFSSSSNTTLNAHIDQCLSGEPTAKWSSPSPSTSKVMAKNKVKPKRFKSMVEVYKSAVHCTLEELDLRNGSNWAGNSNLPAQGTDRAVAAEQKKQVNSSPPANLEDIPDEGDVYIDENGTKVRILSKSGDQSSPPPKKVVYRENVSKFLMSKKKKLLQLQKRHSKLMKHNRKNFSRPHRSFSKIDDDQDKDSSGEESSEKEARVTRRQFRSKDEPSSSRQDTIRGWSGSKRTEITKRSRSRESAQFSGVESNRFSRGRRSTLSGVTSFSSLKSSKRTDKPFVELHENTELPLRKRLRHASVESQLPVGGERSSQAVKPLRKEKRPSREDRVSQITKRKEKRSNQEDSVSHMTKRKVQMFVGQAKKVDHPIRRYPKPSSGGNAKDRMPSGSGSKSSFKRKLTVCKKSRVEFSSESSEEETDRYNHDRRARTSDMVSVDRTRVFKNRYLHDSEDQGGSFMLGRSDDDDDDDEDSDDESAQKNFNTSEEEDMSDGMQFHEADSSTDDQSDMERFTDDHRETETLHIEDQDPILNSNQPDQEMFCGTEVPENLTVTVTELDPIPIPGPPGSFLPSPERMVSEDLAGRSSLTSSRIQSSDDRHELLDQTSDSPVSALSAISNPTLAANGSSLQVLAEMKDKLKINVGDDQPCCCQKPSESQLLLRRADMMLPFRLDSFKSDISSVTSTLSPEEDVKGPNSPSTPMLRLMGKDLVVVSNEVSQPPPQPRAFPEPSVAAVPGMLPLMPPSGYRMMQPANSSNLGWRNAVNNPPEIIVIDDGPENEAPAHQPRGMMQPTVPATMAPVSGSGFRPNGSGGYGISQYDQHHHGAYRGLWIAPSNAGNGVDMNLNVNPPPPAQWNWPPGGSGMVHPNPSPQLRPRYYTYHPNFK